MTESKEKLARRCVDEQERLNVSLRDIFEQQFNFNQLIGLRVESFDPEAPRLSFAMRSDLMGSYLHKRLHGGVIATALDTVGGFSVVVALAEKYDHETAEQIINRFGRFGTIDLRVDYLRQGVGEHFYASAQVMRLGGRIASARMELVNETGTLIATGTAAYVTS